MQTFTLYPQPDKAVLHKHFSCSVIVKGATTLVSRPVPCEGRE